MKRLYYAIFTFFFIIITFSGCLLDSDITKIILTEFPTIFFVDRIIDGDTIVLTDGTKIRYIGINTPEIGVPCYEEAKKANEALVKNNLVRLEYDVEQKDKYDRTLAYVYVEIKGELIFVNTNLVRNGWAEAEPYPPNIKYKDEIKCCENKARYKCIGIWKDGTPPPLHLLPVRIRLCFIIFGVALSN